MTHNFLTIGLPIDLKCHFYLILDSYEKRASKSVFSSIPLTISKTFKKNCGLFYIRWTFWYIYWPFIFHPLWTSYVIPLTIFFIGVLFVFNWSISLLYVANIFLNYLFILYFKLYCFCLQWVFLDFRSCVNYWEVSLCFQNMIWSPLPKFYIYITMCIIGT